mmetsp:Transcript_37773/g.70470  ORF Transcript_37773/g.70470 Transcript_37773/m.70470 type:complete len:184 (+) Transcript_37773:59-610(+)
MAFLPQGGYGTECLTLYEREASFDIAFHLACPSGTCEQLEKSPSQSSQDRSRKALYRHPFLYKCRGAGRSTATTPRGTDRRLTVQWLHAAITGLQDWNQQTHGPSAPHGHMPLGSVSQAAEQAASLMPKPAALACSVAVHWLDMDMVVVALVEDVSRVVVSVVLIVVDVPPLVHIGEGQLAAF